MGTTTLHQIASERGTILRKVHDNDLPTVKTGFAVLDQRTAGFRSGDFIVIGARPGMGKTTFAQNLAYNIATQNSPYDEVLFFSGELPNTTVADRAISDISGIDAWKLRTNHLDNHDLKNIDHAVQGLDGVPLLIDDTTHMSITELATRVRQALSDEHNLNTIIIDSIDLLLPYDRTATDYEQKLDKITHSLRNLARELELPIILMVETPRHKPEDGGPKPRLSELKQYGALEKDADLIIFLHRPDYYECNENDDSRRNIVELLVLKNTHGGIGTVEICFHPEKLKFMPLEENPNHGV